ncbi:demethoxyubiquinone hydroxylase family protein [Alphaproteobacteria bacterium]|nr:demethoxyubiquinone hydroxylase family protein [Alphaproteobacteria bacterium]
MRSVKNKKKLSAEDKKILEEIIRVDHAGEHGATQIYRGQLSVFKKNSTIWKKIVEMAEQEEIHKSTFDELIIEKGVRPTSLFPLWNKAGYILGLGTALLGEKAAMACTVAVEEVIGGHYEEQVKILSKNKIDPKLLKIVKKFREDELEHHDTGVNHNAEMTPGYTVLSKVIKQACYLAIKVTKKY